jgi:hypothetical protein
MAPKESAMQTPRARWSLPILACLMLAACQDRREPVKPTVAHVPAAVAAVA